MGLKGIDGIDGFRIFVAEWSGSEVLKSINWQITNKRLNVINSNVIYH